MKVRADTVSYTEQSAKPTSTPRDAPYVLSTAALVRRTGGCELSLLTPWFSCRPRRTGTDRIALHKPRKCQDLSPLAAVLSESLLRFAPRLARQPLDFISGFKGSTRDQQISARQEPSRNSHGLKAQGLTRNAARTRSSVSIYTITPRRVNIISSTLPRSCSYSRHSQCFLIGLFPSCWRPQPSLVAHFIPIRSCLEGQGASNPNCLQSSIFNSTVPC